MEFKLFQKITNPSIDCSYAIRAIEGTNNNIVLIAVDADTNKKVEGKQMNILSLGEKGIKRYKSFDNEVAEELGLSLNSEGQVRLDKY